MATALAQERPQLPAGAARHAFAACEALCVSCGCAGVEALLGWWRPPQAEYVGDGAQVFYILIQVLAILVGFPNRLEGSQSKLCL